jgi:hypothetical protein
LVYLVAVALAVPFHVLAIRRLSGGQPAKTRLLLEMGKGPDEAPPFRTAFQLAALDIGGTREGSAAFGLENGR